MIGIDWLNYVSRFGWFLSIMTPLNVTFKVRLRFEFPSAPLVRTVPRQLWHVIYQRIQQIFQSLDLLSFFLSCHIQNGIQLFAQFPNERIQFLNWLFTPKVAHIWDPLQIVDGLCWHLSQFHIFQICVFKHVYEFVQNFNFQKGWLYGLMQRHVYYNTHRVEDLISQSLVQSCNQICQKSVIFNELFGAETRVPGKIRQNSHSFYLNFFILLGVQVRFDCLENCGSNWVFEERSNGSVVVENICDATDRV